VIMRVRPLRLPLDSGVSVLIGDLAFERSNVVGSTYKYIRQGSA
jgi:hypothetical protein